MGEMVTEMGEIVTHKGDLVTEKGDLVTVIPADGLPENREIDMLVVKSNDLIRHSRFELNLQEYKLILYLISKIRPGDDDFREYDCDLATVCSIMGVKPCGKNYKDIRDALKALSDRSFWVRIGNADALCRWISKVRIYPGESRITVRLDDDLKPYLLQLKSSFTAYELEYAMGMRSKYSIRLYEIIHSYSSLERFEISVDDLRRLLNADNYENFKDFRRCVLESSVQEINAVTELQISADPVRRGRSYASVIFEVRRKTAQERAGLIRELGKRGIIK